MICGEQEHSQASTCTGLKSTLQHALRTLSATFCAASAWMFPWEKRQMDGSGPLRTWERIYWGGFVTALSLFLFSRLNNKSSNAADPEVPLGTRHKQPLHSKELGLD